MPDSANEPPDAVPVAPRPAASVLVLREAMGGLRVLMGLRGAGHRFMPNMLVFPGGAVDPEDSTAPVASALRPAVQARLRADAGPVSPQALAVAAARELQEETGLSLGEPPALAPLDYLCRAITPASRPLRFDAHFFVVAADALTGTLAGSGELEDLRYYRLDEALTLDLALVTRGVIGQLRTWLALSEAEREARPRVRVLRERIWMDS